MTGSNTKDELNRLMSSAVRFVAALLVPPLAAVYAVLRGQENIGLIALAVGVGVLGYLVYSKRWRFAAPYAAVSNLLFAPAGYMTALYFGKDHSDLVFFTYLACILIIFGLLHLNITRGCYS